MERADPRVLRAARAQRAHDGRAAEVQVHDLVERMLRTSGRRVDVSQPFVDALLPDGSRLHVVIPDVTRRHWAVNIRRHVLPAARSRSRSTSAGVKRRADQG